MCDVAIIFNLLNQIEKQTTLKDIPFGLYLLWLMLFLWVERNGQVTSQGKKSKGIEGFSCSFHLHVG